ncbi:MAG: hypothetical protein CMJ13_02760 [Pelagibacterales bacterium]|nr:hypothetical protein [Pelagibacterales bacterium]
MNDNDNLIFLLGPTNTGKTYYAIEKMLTFSNGIIGLPLRLLAREVYDRVAEKIGKLKVALITGEEQISPKTAKYFITTVEAMPSEKYFEFLAVDEIQLCNDFERGHIFTDRLLNSRGTLETLFLGSDSMEKIIKRIFLNPNILKKERRSNISFIGKKAILSLPKRSAIIAFNSNDVYSIASKIKSVKGGAAIVMGSLSPQTRNSQVAMFEEGTVDYIVATDAIGMGLNLNIKNVAFSSLYKFDGKESRLLKNNEIGQIAGRAGRNNSDGSFCTTLNCNSLSSEAIKALENHNYDANEYLFWRESNLDFSNINNLIRSLEKKSNDPKLIKTQNKRDENILKYLSSLDLIKNRLNDQKNIKLLWDISLIPDYFKNLDSMFSDLLVKIFCSIVDTGLLNCNWAISETRKLQDLEGTIDMLTFRLAKTRFWNYISNRNHWTNNNKELKTLALETEKFLSDALHQRLTNEFVDKKIRLFLREYNLKKSIEIKIGEGNLIFLNEKNIGSISGFQLKIDDEKTLFKNKFLKKEISNKVRLVLEKFARNFINEKSFHINFDNEANVYVNKRKIGSIYQGTSLFKPNLIIINNNYLDEKTYTEIFKKVKKEIEEKIQKIFWGENDFSNLKNKNIKSFLFSIEKNFGIIEKNQIEVGLIPESKYEKSELSKREIFFGKHLFYYKNLINENNRDIRWILGCIYFNGKVLGKAPKNKIIFDASNFSKSLLHLTGYIKIKNFGIEIIFLEKIINKIYSKKRRLFYFNYSILNQFNIPSYIIVEILIYLDFARIAGTSNVSYWKKKKKNNFEKSYYNKNSPFYVLKKLQ